MKKSEFLARNEGLAPQMPVFTQDGLKLGYLKALEDDFFVIEKGFFFPRDFAARYSDVSSVREGALYLSDDRATLERWHEEEFYGWKECERRNLEADHQVVHTEISRVVIILPPPEVGPPRRAG